MRLGPGWGSELRPFFQKIRTGQRLLLALQDARRPTDGPGAGATRGVRWGREPTRAFELELGAPRTQARRDRRVGDVLPGCLPPPEPRGGPGMGERDEAASAPWWHQRRWPGGGISYAQVPARAPSLSRVGLEEEGGRRKGVRGRGGAHGYCREEENETREEGRRELKAPDAERECQKGREAGGRRAGGGRPRGEGGGGRRLGGGRGRACGQSQRAKQRQVLLPPRTPWTP